MNLALLALYNVAAAGLAFAGLLVGRRHTRTGIAMMLAAVLALVTLLTGGAVLFVPVVLAFYGLVLGVPALAVWFAVRRFRRRRDA